MSLKNQGTKTKEFVEQLLKANRIVFLSRTSTDLFQIVEMSVYTDAVRIVNRSTSSRGFKWGEQSTDTLSILNHSKETDVNFVRTSRRLRLQTSSKRRKMKTIATLIR